MKPTAIDSFETYLFVKKKLSKTTVTGYLRLQNEFLNWLEEERFTVQEISYNDLLAYVRFCLDKGDGKRYVNSRLSVIRHYFNYLLITGEVHDNIADNLHLHGVSRRIPHDLLEEETLENLYKNHPTESVTDKRNKVIVGLLIYQGLTSSEIGRLEPKHLLLEQGKLYVPGTRKSNSRELPLSAHQIIPIQTYLHEIRPLIIALNQKETDKLFTSMGRGHSISNLLATLSKQLEKLHPDFKSLIQIRTSVITIWLQNFNLRQVQYMAGHRYISSTERYQLSNLDDLKKDVQHFHPL